MAISKELVAQAIKDLSLRINTPMQKISLKSVEAVDWPDASLGCPEEGRMYAQVVTPGYRLMLSDGARDFEYHSDSLTRVRHCGGG